mmetsp:Transcript_25117/g.45525  ORF Transcript_25117/g.45525 Transcript_25117/m.45525 type:complete len:104 (+) Transcript_25117:945-1256(+)
MPCRTTVPYFLDLEFPRALRRDLKQMNGMGTLLMMVMMMVTTITTIGGALGHKAGDVGDAIGVAGAAGMTNVTNPAGQNSNRHIAGGRIPRCPCIQSTAVPRR